MIKHKHSQASLLPVHYRREVFSCLILAFTAHVVHTFGTLRPATRFSWQPLAPCTCNSTLRSYVMDCLCPRAITGKRAQNFYCSSQRHRLYASPVCALNFWNLPTLVLIKSNHSLRAIRLCRVVNVPRSCVARQRAGSVFIITDAPTCVAHAYMRYRTQMYRSRSRRRL